MKNVMTLRQLIDVRYVERLAAIEILRTRTAAEAGIVSKREKVG